MIEEGRAGEAALLSTTIHAPCTFMNIHHDNANHIVSHNNYHYNYHTIIITVRVLREAVKMSSLFCDQQLVQPMAA